MEPLAQIESFGGIDADTDALLEACFQDHEAYREAVSHTRFVILGRKGSGKTAIYRKLIRTREHDVFAFGHTFSDYPWPHHHLQGSIAVPEEQRYVHSWQYLILLTVAKILLNKDQSQPWNVRASEELTKLKSFMVDSYGSRDPDVTELFSPTKTLRIHPHLKITQMIDVGVDLESFPMSELPKVFQDVNRTIATSVATCLNPNHHYYVCFDELDRGFDPSDNLYSQMLVGLILAARAITQQIRDAGKHFSVVVFLRDDIYELLRFEGACPRFS